MAPLCKTPGSHDHHETGVEITATHQLSCPLQRFSLALTYIFINIPVKVRVDFFPSLKKKEILAISP